MLRDRLRTSAVLISIVLLLVWLDLSFCPSGAEGIWLLPLLVFFAGGTAWEIATMLRSAGQPVRRKLTVLGTILVSASAAVPYLWVFSTSSYPIDCPIGRLGWIVLAASACVFLFFLAEMRDFGRSEATERGIAIRRTSAAVFVSIYVGIPMAILIGLRALHAGSTGGRFGMAALISLIIVTKVSDAGAYFTGKAFGRHKLIPRLSPGKTVEGALGGILASIIAAYLCLTFLFDGLGASIPAGLASGATGTTELPANAVKTGLSAILARPVWGGVVLGVVCSITGMIGDLAESLCKRDSGVKDSGQLLPGLGGVWDVTDSLIAASVPGFFCFAAGVGGP